ncbi:pentatricopeptide repeat-containing protein At4g30700-like [Cryptomeria japonica]|uniref:pentatricopeptide repeat-containing protein At4g30700-like n=1 Tax=Cryptomeria japonica TaxID=3369 RepID=UPI0027D9DEF8|nr:pentatricopeptide repeat-containing protein At4g30700-like [Cryptomeria japonica]
MSTLSSAFATCKTFNNNLIYMYVKCGNLVDARKVFDHMKERDSFSWNTIIAAYRRRGYPQEAVTLFHHMQQTVVRPDRFTFASVLPACAKMGALEQGMSIHKIIKDRRILSEVVVATALVDMYAKCGSIDKAAELFDTMLQRNVVTWNAMIAGYAQNGFVEKALETFKQMNLAGVKPDLTSFISILPVCAKMGALEQGMDIHQSMKDGGILSNIVAATALVDMYAKCGSIDKARELFDRMPQKDVFMWTAMIAGYTQNGYAEKALETFKEMQSAGIKPNSTTFASVLPACATMGALEQGIDIHQSIMEGGFLSHIIVGNALVDMYAKCGSVGNARELFDRMLERDVITWTAMIAGYAQNGFVEKALETFKQMQLAGVKPNSATFACVLCACSHAGLVDEGCTYFNHMSNPYCITPTVDHYACMVDLLGRAGYLEDTLNFIIKMPVKPMVVVWICFLGACRSHMNIGLAVFTATLLFDLDPKNDATYVLLSNIYAEAGWWNEVQMVRRLMRDRGIKKIPGCSWTYLKGPGGRVACENANLSPSNYHHKMPLPSTTHLNLTPLCRDSQLKDALHILFTTHNPPEHYSTYFQLLQTCLLDNALSQGKKIHSFIAQRRFAFATGKTVHNKLIYMYVKCGSLVEARKVFDHMKERDCFSWNTIIAAYRRHRCPHEAVTLFHHMQQAGLQPDRFTFASVLPACAKIGALEQGMDIHRSIKDRGILSDVVVATALVDMYAKCGSIDKAREVFDRISQKNVVSWNAMIAGYAQNGFFEMALKVFKQMQLAGVKPDLTTFASILPACAKLGALELGMDIHQSIKNKGILSDIVVTTALVDMYAKCGSIDRARELFDTMPQKDAFLWTAMIAAYEQNGLVEKALETFKQMQLAGVKPDSTTFASILPACAKMGALKQGIDIHQSIKDRGILSDIVVATSLVDMYAKCGSIDMARELFDGMPQRNVHSWTAMIGGYAQNGFVEKALETFKQMQLAGVKPNSATFASVLPACAKMGALEQGMDIHQSIMEGGFFTDIIVGNALIDMYAKCGSIDKAHELFDRMPQRDVISWTAMIAGYAQNGFVEEALQTFMQMQSACVKPNSTTFACVLCACSYAGLVDEGCTYFNHMSKPYCITPTIDHYVCMVDLLGRAGYLEDTLNFIIKMPVKPVVIVWICFLGACRSHMNIGLGVFTATLLFDLDPKNASAYVLLSNIYAEVGRWCEVQMVRRLMEDRGIKKIPGCSWIEHQKMVHVFCVGDRSHPQAQEIYAKLEKLAWEMKMVGYFSDSRRLLNDVEDEERELFLCHHSEKLAIVFGLLNTPPGTTIRVVKNLRVCTDCHTATKFISKIVAREIVVRDANRFHHFKQGECSCGDYW